jgi:hypothetical protein
MNTISANQHISLNRLARLQHRSCRGRIHRRNAAGRPQLDRRPIAVGRERPPLELLVQAHPVHQVPRVLPLLVGLGQVGIPQDVVVGIVLGDLTSASC